MPVTGGSPANRAVDTNVVGNELLITVRKEFDAGNVHQDWAQSVQVMHPGAFERIVFDLSACGLLSSTFFAGLMQLYTHYSATGKPVMVLRHPDPRVVRNLKALRLDKFFTVEPRAS